MTWLQPPHLLKQDRVTGAIARLKSKVIATELASAGWSEEAFAELGGFLRRGQNLVLRRPAASAIKRRAEFFDALEGLATAHYPAATRHLREARHQLEIAEDGYRRILASLDQTAWKALGPERRVAATLQRVGREVADALETARTQLIGKGFLNLGTPVLRDAEGRPVDFEAPVDAAVSGLGSTLLMEAYEQGWFDGDEVVLPALPTVDDEDVAKAGEALLLAMNWERWEAIEEQSRYLGPGMVQRGPEVLPNDAARSCEKVYVYSPPGWQWYNQAAVWRGLDRARQSRVENSASLSTLIRPTGVHQKTALAPEGVVSEAEAHGYIGLCERLGLDVCDHQRAFEGLRIVEWLRGFAALGVMARERFEADGQQLQAWPRKAIVEMLDLVGLGGARANAFLAKATLQKASRDLFDSPLIRRHDGSYLVFAPSLVDNSPAEVVLSLLATYGASFDGAPFEDRVRELLRENGLQAEGFRFKRDGEEYEYDAVAVWGDFVFVFECKNRSLPGLRASPAYYFQLELAQNVRQLLRLKSGLEAAPEQLDKRFGPGTSGKRVVLVALRNLTYSRQGDVQGVHFYDYSALSRFFHTPELSAQAADQRGNVARAGHTRVWAGEKPEPDDLLRELADPVQLRISHFHSRKMRIVVGLDQETVALSEVVVREEITPESLGAFAGLPNGELQRRLDARMAALQAGFVLTDAQAN